MKHKTEKRAKLVIERLRLALVVMLSITASMLMVGCFKKPFNVNVQAEEPINVNLSMDVHVYNHGGTSSVKTSTTQKASTSESASDAQAYKAALDSRRTRMEEVQNMKNGRYVGENHLGLLELRSLPEEKSAAEWVKKTLKEENDDRKFLMNYEVKSRDKSLKEVQSEQRNHLQLKSHPGEWIEIDDPETPGSYKWIQKESLKRE